MRTDLEGLGPRFRLDALVAEGGVGSVYRGVDERTGAPVAIKRLHEHLCEPLMIARFEREARLLEGIAHPHVVRHVAHGRDEQGRPFLATEWLDGEDLAVHCAAARPAAGAIVDLVRQAALGLAALHGAGIVHRDVKPSAFLLARTEGGPRVALIDLGVACAVGERAREGVTVGTPAYMSPERASGREDPTPASDVFSLGVVLFELVAGRRPYRSDDVVSLAMKIALEDPPRLRDAMPGVAPELDALCARAMAKAPDARFPDARAMAEALASPAAVDECAAPTPRVVTVLFASFDLIGRRWGGAGRAPRSVPSAQEGNAARPLAPRCPPERSAAIGAFRDAAVREGGVYHSVLGPHRAAVFDDASRAASAASASRGEARVRLALVTGSARAGGLDADLVERGIAEMRMSHGEVRLDEATSRAITSSRA